MDSPLVTILLPVYNGEKTLKASLDSLLNQTFTNFEVIIGIDGSNDSSKSIALEFNDKRIKIIEHPKNLGLANNLNTIIKDAHYESQYFAMAEQDDIYVPHRLEWQLEAMKIKGNIGMVSGIAEFENENGNILFPGILVYNGEFPKGTDMFKYLYINQLKVVNTCLFWRKDVHLNNKLVFRNTYGNFNVDWDFVLRFSLLKNIYGVNKVLVKMNRNKANNSVTTDKWQQYLASRALLKDFNKEFSSLISHQIYKEALKAHCKIELGHYKKQWIVYYCLIYTAKFKDFYFIKYLAYRLNKYGKKKY